MLGKRSWRYTRLLKDALCPVHLTLTTTGWTANSSDDFFAAASFALFGLHFLTD